MTAGGRFEGVDVTRMAALLAVLLALGASLQILYHFIDVVGIPVVFLGLVVTALVLATGAARVVRARMAVAVGAVLLAAGLAWYLAHLGGNPPVGALLADTMSLLAGQSLLGISAIRAWVLGVAPAPVFLSWYFAMRRWYTPAVAVAGGTLGFFVLTGDADVVTTSAGVVAGAAALGVGDLERRGERLARAETVLVVAAVMIIVPSVISVVPATAGAAGPLVPALESGGTLEENLLNADEQMTVQGSIDLSPSVRFTVTSEAPAYWRVGSYDRYTGDGWVRTSEAWTYEAGDRRRGPVGQSTAVEQTVRVEDRSSVLPTAWKPVQLNGVDNVRARSDGGFEPGEPLANGTTYRVTSQVPDHSATDLQNAGTDYPEEVEDRFTQLPASTPDRVAERTDTLTADAETPYETALVIEQYLQNNKNYSLDVARPRDDVADTFLFEMDEGYCTYYATTMATMLRTQDIPARFVVGYGEGERVAEDQWVVRGLNSHAWVEVYFPDHGWVQFDPTPAGPRDQTRDVSVEQARENDEPNVDTSATSEQDEEWTPTETPTPVPLTTVPEESNDTDQQVTQTPPPEIVAGIATDQEFDVETPTESGGDDGAGLGPRLPTRQQLALGLVALVGSVVGIRRSGVGQRAYRTLWLRYQPRSDPATDVERAFQRLEYHLGEQAYRPRWEDETVREYLAAIDAGEDARRVAEIRERARYRGAVTEAEADEAVRLVNELVR